MIKNSSTQVCFSSFLFFCHFLERLYKHRASVFYFTFFIFRFLFFISFQSFNAEINEKSVSRGINVACNTNKNISKNLFHFSSIIVRAYKSCQMKRLVASGYLL